MTLIDAIKKQRFASGMIIVPWLFFIIFVASGNLLLLDYIHVLIGAIWTGTDVFLGLIFNRVIKTLDGRTKYDISQRILPMSLYFIPSATILTPLAGMILAIKENAFNGLSTEFIVSLFVIGIILLIISFILILPTSLKIRNLANEIGEEVKFAKSSYLLKKLTIYGGIQLLFQVLISGFMTYLVVF